MKIVGFFQIFLWSILVMACTRDQMPDPKKTDLPLKNALSELKITYIPGLFYSDEYTVDNGITNQLVQFCKPLLDVAASKIIDKKPDILLTCGLNYNRSGVKPIQEKLDYLASQGIKIFVLPGSYDHSIMSNAEFESTYNAFGYKKAISIDPNSASYLAEAADNLWLLAIDASNQRISENTLTWALNCLAMANENQKTVIGLLPYSAVDDWENEIIYGPAYTILNPSAIDALIDAGLKITFSHSANDIVTKTVNNKTLYDIGSTYLVTPPYSFRRITLNSKKLGVETAYIKSLDSSIPVDHDFLNFSNTRLQNNVTNFMIRVLVKSYRLPLGDENTPGTAMYYASHYATALRTYYSGNEKFPPDEMRFSREWPEPFKSLLEFIYTDLKPQDLECEIQLNE